MNLFRSALSACVVNGLKYTKVFLCSNDTSITYNHTTSSALLPSVRTNNMGQVPTPAATVGLTPITLAGLNQSLRNFTHARIQ